VFGDFEQRWLLRGLQRESDIGSAVVGSLSQPPAHRHAFERQRSGGNKRMSHVSQPSTPLTRLSRSRERLRI